MISVLGLDPGKTTGFAQIHVVDQFDNECNCFVPWLDGDGQHAPDCQCFKRSGRIIQPTLQYGNTTDMTLGEIQHLIVESDAICYEGWRTFKKKAESGALNFQKVYAEQVIGSMKTLIRVLNLSPKVHENLSSVKPVGYGYANMKYVPGAKGKHWQDALCHAVWYAVEKLGARPLE